jgi:hypothetical protein
VFLVLAIFGFKLLKIFAFLGSTKDFDETEMMDEGLI